MATTRLVLDETAAIRLVLDEAAAVRLVLEDFYVYSETLVGSVVVVAALAGFVESRPLLACAGAVLQPALSGRPGMAPAICGKIDSSLLSGVVSMVLTDNQSGTC